MIHGFQFTNPLLGRHGQNGWYKYIPYIEMNDGGTALLNSGVDWSSWNLSRLASG